jgi:integrase
LVELSSKNTVGRAYLSHLAVAKNVAASTQNIALSALLFLYKQVLQIDLPYIDQIERAKKPIRLPVVYSRDEAKTILANLEGTTYLIVALLYGCGLRLIECLSLRVKDPDIAIRDPQSFLHNLKAKLTVP